SIDAHGAVANIWLEPAERADGRFVSAYESTAQGRCILHRFKLANVPGATVGMVSVPFALPSPIGRSFDEAAATSALAQVDVSQCKLATAGALVVTFGPSGAVTRNGAWAPIDPLSKQAALDAQCVRKAFGGARVAPYAGGEVS